MRIYVTRHLPGIAPDLLREAFGADNVVFYPEEHPVPRAELLQAVRGADAATRQRPAPPGATPPAIHPRPHGPASARWTGRV